MSNSQLSVLIQRQAEKYGDRVALKYRDYDTETWVPVSWKQFAETVTTTSNALLELGVGVQENIGVFSQNPHKGIRAYFEKRHQYWCLFSK